MYRSRIVYSREQLLSLASSPLSQTPPHIPAEISRSPEKTSLLGQAANNRTNGVKVGSNGSSGAGLGKAPASEVFGGSGGVGSGSLQMGNSNTRTPAAVPRSPPAISSRSPGNAFNFTKGPVSPDGMSHSTSFKERMAAAQQQSSQSQQQQQQPGRQTRQGSDGSMPSSGNGAGDESNRTQGDEQFSMEM